MSENKCEFCGISLTETEMIRLKAATYDDIIKHLLESGCDARRREQARCKIALRNIKKWAQGNLNKKEIVWG
jgi:hypothetical protein